MVLLTEENFHINKAGNKTNSPKLLLGLFFKGGDHLGGNFLGSKFPEAFFPGAFFLKPLQSFMKRLTSSYFLTFFSQFLIRKKF